jgi:hypothetical protein
MAPDLMTRAGDDGETWPFCSSRAWRANEKCRVTTLEVNEGEGMRGSSHFSRLTDRRAHIPDSGARSASALSAVRARQSPTLPGSVCEPIEDHPNEKRKRSQCSCLVVARPTLHQRTRPWNRPARGRSTVGGVVGASSTARPLMPTHECERPSLIHECERPSHHS